MKRVLLLLFVLIFGYILLHRERGFVRDPLATVYLDGAAQAGWQVYINYSNDVLLERDAQPARGYGILVQNWNRIPGNPATLKCIHWMACMTDADHATALPLDHTGPGAYDPRTSMSSRVVSFADGEGHTLRVTLR
ncbi:MAG: hypothetical protein M3O02_03065 [Acidobacteriota bacterium]|nr:hypothetical protein [Acidobacteriota bacterium]